MQIDQMRALVAVARVAHLGTIDHDGRAHLVPCVFALERDTVHLVVDRKPKRSTALRRLANLRRDPRATLLVDHYEEDWRALWWVRMRGRARIVDDERDVERTLALLRAKYEQYDQTPLTEIAIRIEIDEWRGWRAAG